MLLKDHQRQRLLTRGDQAFVSDDEDEDAPPPPDGAGAAAGESYNAQQARLRRAFHGDSGTRGCWRVERFKAGKGVVYG